MSAIHVQAEPELATDARSTIVEGLIAYNQEQGYVWRREPLNAVARDAEGRVVGGLLGEVNLGWLFVSALWVDAGSRRSGVGSQLMRVAEAEARRRGCTGIHLDTFSFQARPFYERLGYRLFGELPDCPAGAARYYLYKLLDPAAR